VFPAVSKTMGKSFWKRLRRLYKQSIEDMTKKKRYLSGMMLIDMKRRKSMLKEDEELEK